MQIVTGDTRRAIINSSPDSSNITVRNPDVLWAKIIAKGTINLETTVGQPAITWNAAAWIEQEPDIYGRPIDKLNGMSGNFINNPLIGSITTTSFNVGTYVYIKKRKETGNAFFALWEVAAGGGGSGTGIDSVQCIGNILYVVYN